MKVVHINVADTRGGASIAAYRHHLKMREMGVDSTMFVIDRFSSDENVGSHKASKISLFLRKGANFLTTLLLKPYGAWSWNLPGYDISTDRAITEADVIIFHWMNKTSFSLKSMEKIVRSGKPVYWFMHDMWPFTGGCHHAFDCRKYTTACTACPMLHGVAAKAIDWARLQFNVKEKRLKGYNNLKFVAPSRWLAECLHKSSLFSENDYFVARNIVDTNVFKIHDKQEARKALGLPADKKLILFGADNITSPYKGWNFLREVLENPFPGTECVVYGKSPENLAELLSMRLHNFGHISSAEKLAMLYSACDVIVTPSLADNYPNVIREAMACGLPVVGFNTGGIPEMIDHKVNGFLTKRNNSRELREGIEYILFESNMNPETVRKKIIDEQQDYTLMKIIQNDFNV